MCRVTSSSDAGTMGNNGIDIPCAPQSTFPAPPTKRPYHRPLDSSLTSNAQQLKTKSSSSANPAVDQNMNGIAVQGHSDSVDSASRSSDVLESVGHKKPRHYSGSCENVRQTGLSDSRGPRSGLSTTADAGMQVLWSGQVAVNGNEICSAELVSRCRIRHDL